MHSKFANNSKIERDLATRKESYEIDRFCHLFALRALNARATFLYRRVCCVMN